MKNRDLINLLNRAAVGFEHLVSLTEKERDELVEDLLQAATDLEYAQGRVVEEIDE